MQQKQAAQSLSLQFIPGYNYLFKPHGTKTHTAIMTDIKGVKIFNVMRSEEGTGRVRNKILEIGNRA
jgi:hypothetical protein